MDSYLESLTRKSEEAIDAAVEETVEAEEAAEVEETVEEIDDSNAAEETEDLTVEEPAEEDKEDEAEEQVDEEAPEEAEDAAKAEPVDEPDDKPALQAASSEVTHQAGELINVVGIRVFNTPSFNQPFRIISGNVTYDGKVDGFIRIEYMKSGFGMVKGYTPDLK